MSKIRWFMYSVYLAVLAGFAVLSRRAVLIDQQLRAETYNAIPGLISSMIIFIFIGMLLGFEKLLQEVKKEGSWRIDLPKAILLGIPSMYFAFGLFIYVCPIEFIRRVFGYPIEFFIRGDFNFLPVFQIFFGYFAVTSFIKCPKPLHDSDETVCSGIQSETSVL